MRIRVEFHDTEPLAKEGAYVFDSGEVAGLPTSHLVDGIVNYLLRSLHELRVLEVKQ